MAKIVYWARLPFGREMLTQSLPATQGMELRIVHTLEECIDALPGTDGMILYNCRAPDAQLLGQAIRQSAPGLRWMHFLTAGMDGFDKVELPEQVHITQTGGASAPVVAEHAMALLLALGRGLPACLQQQAQQLWDRGVATGVSSLEQKTVTIVGLGFIGQQIARRARAFGVRVLGVTRHGHADPAADACYPLQQLEQALQQSDVVVLAIALNPQTRHLINRQSLAACKRGAMLINVSRGAVVDTEALCAALHSGQLAAAGLDVTDPEPLPPEHPLWQAPGVLITPHIAVEGSRPTEQRIAEGAMEQLQHFLRTHSSTSDNAGAT